MKILGIHGGATALQNGASAALIMEGRIVVAAEEERFVRFKEGFGHSPIRSIQACLKEAKLKISEIDLIVHAGVTHKDLHKRIELYMNHYFGSCPEIYLVDHQLAHLASAYYCSPFDEAMCVSFDGYGDEISVTLAKAKGRNIQMIERRGMYQSLGVFYKSITSFLGFGPLEEEYKVMGLASYGREGVELSDFLNVENDDYSLDHTYCRRYGKSFEKSNDDPNLNPRLLSRFEPWYSSKLTELLGKPRQRNESINQRHKDIAFASQKKFEEAAVTLIKRLYKKTGLRKLAIAGGCGLNCKANKVYSDLDFVDEIFVQPAASDRGLSLGSALLGSNKLEHSVPRGLQNVYLGPTYGEKEIKNALNISQTKYTHLKKPYLEAAKRIANGEIVGWFQGRSEFGPRALGNRSILADPTRANMKDLINSRVKFREEFRPFAPAVIEECCSQIFDLKSSSPFMTVAANVKEEWRNKLKAVTHVDGTARVQTVNPDQNPLFYKLIFEFRNIAGVPVVLNTSFNLMGEPIVETPMNAISTFSASGLDSLIIGEYLVTKK